MDPEKQSPQSIPQGISGNDNIVIGKGVSGKDIVVGNNNTIIQKIINVFKGDTETTEQRNRRIMLNHVENFWVKGILGKSLHEAALLELGIKENPDALSYPWAIKRETTKETLPAGTTMLEIFQEIGLGRSLLILGAPGSGKTTMLLELTRQLIERARQDVSEPVPVVFNLASWAEKLTLTDWLAAQLNLIYSVPKKFAPSWVKENKMLLLLDGLDEVKQVSRDKCVEAINHFRKDNGLTNLAVCSRSQDYADLKMRLALEGAIEIQPLTSNQVDEYFECFGKGLEGIKQALEKDAVLREMAETPLFLSIMTLAYSDVQSKGISVFEDVDTQRNRLFDTYIDRMFRYPRSKNKPFERKDVERWLSWLAQKMIKHNQVPYLLENMQPTWFNEIKQFGRYYILTCLISGLFGGSIGILLFEWVGGPFSLLLSVLFIGMFFSIAALKTKISTVDALSWNWEKAMKGVIGGLIFELGTGLISGLAAGLLGGLNNGLIGGVLLGLTVGLIFGIVVGTKAGLSIQQIDQITFPGQRLALTFRNFLFGTLLSVLIGGLIVSLLMGVISEIGVDLKHGLHTILSVGLLVGLFGGITAGLEYFGGVSLVQHHTLRFILARNKLLPWKLIPFLDYCTDLIFLRRVGGGYIFVHRLMMEHFAAMYTEKE